MYVYRVNHWFVRRNFRWGGSKGHCRITRLLREVKPVSPSQYSRRSQKHNSILESDGKRFRSRGMLVSVWELMYKNSSSGASSSRLASIPYSSSPHALRYFSSGIESTVFRFGHFIISNVLSPGMKPTVLSFGQFFSSSTSSEGWVGTVFRPLHSSMHSFLNVRPAGIVLMPSQSCKVTVSKEGNRSNGR